MTGGVWFVLACGFLIVLVRRPISGVGLLIAQSAALAIVATIEAQHEPHLVSAAVILAAKALALTGALIFILRRNAWARPVHPRLMPSARALLTLALVGALVTLMPALQLGDRSGEQAAIALLAMGISTTMVRRSTLLQIVGVVVAENGVVLAALYASTPVPFVIELGVALDVVFVIFVALALHSRIQKELGTGDAALLGTLRD